MKKGIKVKCHRCSKEWVYNGKKTPKNKYPQYIVCPRCHTSVKLKKYKKK